MQKITIPQLAQKIMELDYEEELLFKVYKDCDLWGAKRIRIFDGDIILFGYYGGQLTEMYNLETDSDDYSPLIESLKYHINHENDAVYLLEGKDMSSFYNDIKNIMYGSEAQKMLVFLLSDYNEAKQNWQVVTDKKYLVRGIYFEKSRWVVFDNMGKNCNVEEFQYHCQAIKWLKGEIDSDSEIIGFSTLK